MGRTFFRSGFCSIFVLFEGTNVLFMFSFLPENFEGVKYIIVNYFLFTFCS